MLVRAITITTWREIAMEKLTLKTWKLSNHEQRIIMLRRILEALDQVRNTLAIMTDLLQDLEQYERLDLEKKDRAVEDMYHREGWK